MSNKRISAEIVALTPNIPGQAVIQIKNWNLAGGLKFKIKANGSRGYLNETTGRSGWGGSEEYWFHPQAVEQDAQWVRVHIGQTVLDPLLEAGARYKITLCGNEPSQGDTCILSIADDVYPSSAAGTNSAVVSGGVLATPELVSVATAAPAATPELQVTQTPEPQAEPVPAPELELELEEVVEPATQPSDERAQTAEPTPTAASTESNKGKDKVILLALLGVLIVALLAALGWWLSQQKLPSFTNGAAASAAGVAADDGSASGGCALASMGTVDELQFVQSCLQETQDSDTLLAVIQHAKANNHCGIAQRLYANRAQSGDSLIALAYAKEYDPQFYADNTCFKAADTETALYWYETVLLNEPNNAEAAQRVEELNQ